MMRAALLLVVLAGLMATPAAAASRGTRIAMAVALLDVVEEHCGPEVKVDAAVKATLMRHFHEYDIAGLASLLSKPLNSFYEDYSYQLGQGRLAFCRKAPAEARRSGYPVIVAAGG